MRDNRLNIYLITHVIPSPRSNLLTPLWLPICTAGSRNLLTQIVRESQRVELAVHRVDLHVVNVHFHHNEAPHGVLVAPNPARVPPPANLVAIPKHVQCVDDGQRGRLELCGDEDVLGGVRGLAELYRWASS